jgi:hypothetical protein
MQMSLKSVLDFVELQKAIFVSAAAVIGAIGSTIMWCVNYKKAKAEERLFIRLKREKPCRSEAVAKGINRNNSAL